MVGDQPLVSVTLAAYNVDAFIDDCLQSIRAQTYPNFELIVVDDASRDKTREILRRHASRDPRIRLILKEENEGLSVARNEGIRAAKGEFVMFLDGDDLYDPELLQTAVAHAVRENAEMVIWDYVVFANAATIAFRRNEPSGLCECDGQDRVALLGRPAFAWTKMVSRDLLHRIGISFPRGLTYQDVPVHWQLVTKVERIAVVPRRLAFYRQQSAATTAGKGMRRADYFAVLDIVKEYLESSGLLERYADIFAKTQLNAWYGVYDIIDKEHRAAVRLMILERFSAVHSAYVASGKPLRWRARQFYRALAGDPLASALLATWKLARCMVRLARLLLRREVS